MLEKDSSKSPPPELYAKDVEELVKEIKEKLLVRNSKHSVNKHCSRVCPYSLCDRTNYYERKTAKLTNNKSPHEPYKLLQELINQGGLIKEAVRRLQTENAKMKRLENCGYSEHSRISPLGSFSPFTADADG